MHIHCKVPEAYHQSHSQHQIRNLHQLLQSTATIFTAMRSRNLQRFAVYNRNSGPCPGNNLFCDRTHSHAHTSKSTSWHLNKGQCRFLSCAGPFPVICLAERRACTRDVVSLTRYSRTATGFASAMCYSLFVAISTGSRRDVGIARRPSATRRVQV